MLTKIMRKNNSVQTNCKHKIPLSEVSIETVHYKQLSNYLNQTTCKINKQQDACTSFYLLIL